jgi:hypothetical protein
MIVQRVQADPELEPRGRSKYPAWPPLLQYDAESASAAWLAASERPLF